MKLISVNIEGHKHLDKIIPFLRQERPDVLCLQEVFEADTLLLQKELGMAESMFTPLCFFSQDDSPLKPFGIAMASRLPCRRVAEKYYSGSRETLKAHIVGDMATRHGALLYATLVEQGKEMNIGTVHFTYSPLGEADKRQRQDLKALLAILESIPDIAFCGDFNAPRGKEIFDAIAQRYKDNIPAGYHTSIDGALHRSGPLPYMVDGLFTTPHYAAENVRLVDSVSDHCAIVAEIRRPDPFPAADDSKKPGLG